VSDDDVVLRIAPKEIDADEVLAELRHRFESADPNDAIEWTLHELAELDIVRFREPVDDPSKDPVWTVRTVEPTPLGADGNTVVKFGPDYWLFPSNRGNGYGRLDWSGVKTSKVVGVVPGTPAAEALSTQVPGPRCGAGEGATGINCGLPRLHALDVDHEGTHQPGVDGDGIGYQLFVRWPWQQWDRDYSDVALPEWEQQLLARQAAEPRVFSSDGPEPPEDVVCLERLNAPNGARYAKRAPLGNWIWAATSDATVHDDYPGGRWPLPQTCEFREVQSS